MSVVMPNSGGEAPSDASEFLLVQFPASSVVRLPINHRRYREEGGIRLVLNASNGGGPDAILTAADLLADFFRDRKFGGIETQVPSSPFFDDNNENGNYFRASIVVPYSYSFSGE